MFHAYFSTAVAHSGGSTLSQTAERMDHFYGLPSNSQKRAFRQHVERILAVDNWPDFFSMCRVPCLSEVQVTDYLKKAFRESLRLRYHNSRTDFGRIQASGTSSIFARLKREGAKSGEVVVSLLWDNSDDLDLHVTCPCGTHIFYGDRQCTTCHGELDVDMNAGQISDEPVENVYFTNAKRGTYKVVVENFEHRTSEKEVPFEVHVKIKSQQMKLFKKKWTEGSGNVKVFEFRL